MYRLTILFISLSLVFASCNNSSTTNESKEPEVTLGDIASLEEDLFGNELASPDMAKAKELVDMYINYANQHPNDVASPDFLFKAADISMNLSSANNTIALFNRILMEYPNYKNTSTIMFLKGFVYEDQLQDYKNAGKCYIEFLEKYPDSDFTDDAKVSLENLGKTPEELIKEFESKN